MKPAYRKSWARNLLISSDLTLGPLFQGQMRKAKVKSASISLIFGLRGLQCETNLSEEILHLATNASLVLSLIMIIILCSL